MASSDKKLQDEQSLLKELLIKVSAIEQRLSAIETENLDGGMGATPGVGGSAEDVVEQSKLHAFDVFCDGQDTDKWKVYFPSGCFSYHGFEPESVEPGRDKEDENAVLTESNCHDGAIYAHVIYALESKGGGVVACKKIVFDDKAEYEGALDPEKEGCHSFTVATITDDAVTQVVTGALFLGGNGGGGSNKIRVVGTDGSFAETSIGEIKFDSGDDSNVVVHVEKPSAGNFVRASIDVYYK